MAALAAVVAASAGPGRGPAPAPEARGPEKPPFDVQAVMRRVHFSFRQEGARFTGGHSTYAVEADAGRLQVSPVQHRPDPTPATSVPAHPRSERPKPTVGAPLVLQTTSIGRGSNPIALGRSLAVDEEGRLVRAGAAVTEIVQNRSEGVEVSWKFPAKPAGEGALEVRVAASGLEHAGVTSGGLHFRDPESGLGLRYGHATWIGAGGDRTAVPARWNGREIVIEVPAAVVEGSSYPAVLDPAIGPETSLDTPITGAASGAQFAPSTAYSGTNYLVVWQDSRSSLASQIFGTRVSTAGVVLDPNGILFSVASAYADSPTVVWDGTNYLVVFGTAGGVVGRRANTSGALVDAAPFTISAGSTSYPSAYSNGTVTFVAWADYRNYGSSQVDIYGARVTGSAVVDPSGIAISTAPGDQYNPRVTYGNLRWFIVWQDYRNSGTSQTDIYGARVQQNTGSLLDPIGIAISTATTDQYNPWPASNGTDYFVVWHDNRNTATTSIDIYGARVTSATGAVTDPSGIQVCNNNNSQYSPSVAYNGGLYQVVWEDYRGAGLFGNRVNPATGALSDGPAGIRIDSTIATYVFGPRIHATGSTFYVAWALGTVEGDQNVFGSRLGTSTPPIPPPLLDEPGVSLASSGNGQTFVSVAGDGSRYLVVWVDDRGGSRAIYGARVNGTTGASLDPAGILLSAGGTYEDAPAVAFNGTHYLVVWVDARSPYGIWGTRVNPATGAVVDPAGLSLFTTPSNQPYAPHVASDGVGWFVAWSDSRPAATSPDIYGGRVNAAGAAVDPLGILISNASNYQNNPRVGFGGGYYLVVWQDNRFGGNYVYGARVSTTGVVQEATATNIAIATDPFGYTSPGEYGVSYASPNFMVTYTRSSQISRARIASATGTLVDNVTLTGCCAYAPAIVYDQGEFVVVYSVSAPPGYNIKGTRVSTVGVDLDVTDWDVVTGGGVPYGVGGYALAALGPSGRALVAYSRYDSTPGVTSMRARARLVTREPNVDLAVTKTDGVASVVPGGGLTYTVVVSNAGPDLAVGATVTDAFPSALACSTTCSGTGGATCTAGPLAGNINDTVDIPVGESVTYTSVCSVSLAASGSIVNTATATVSAGTIETNPGNNSATDTDAVLATVDLSVTKTDGQATEVPGTSVAYTIVAANAGPHAVLGATVTDSLPSSLVGATWTCAASPGSSCTASGSGSIADSVSLLAGGSATYTLSATVASTATGTLSNTATIAAPAGATETNPADNSATDADTLAPEVDLSITKTDGQATEVPGTPVSYTITVSNAGPSAATGASVTDTLSSILTGATWTCSASPGSSCAASGVGDIADTADLLPGGTLTYSLTATVASSATGTLTNTASVAAPAGVTETDLPNNSATDTDTLTPEVDLVVTKTDSAATAVPGLPVTYAIAVSNAGPSDVVGGTVTDALPATLTGATWTCAASPGSSCTAAGAGSIGDTVTVLAGGSLSYSLTATVDPAAGGTLANTASVTPQSGATDSNPANDAATDTDALTPQADLSIAKSDGQVAVVPAQALSYTITVANAGPSAATGATVTDTLPALLVGAAWTCSASPGSSCAGAGVGNINDTVTLLPGGTLSYSLSATVDPAAAAGPLANTASVAAPSGTADPNGANDSSTDTDTIGIPSLTIADGTVVEGHAGTTTASFTVTLSPAAAVPVTVNYVTQNVTALAGSDYAFTSGMLTFAPGETGKPIDVAVNGDTQFEAHETFRVVLSGATGGAEIDDGLAVGTIANDDAPTGPSRAFVSVAGADTNDCSNIATPCRTLNTAIAQVAEDGEVIVIQSGSYAGAMVTKSVKLTAAPGIVAFSGQPIVVDAGTGGRVVVRGMTLKAATPGSGSGLLIQSAGAVHLESSVVDGWAFGIRQQGAERLFVEDSVIRNNGTGIQASTGKASVEGTRLTNNGIGVASDFATVSLRGCTVSGNSAAGVSADSSSSVTLEKCQIANNGVGITLPAWSFSTVRLSRSVVSGNTVGLENVDGTLIVAGTNAVRGNTFDVSGSTTANGLQ